MEGPTAEVSSGDLGRSPARRAEANADVSSGDLGRSPARRAKCEG